MAGPLSARWPAWERRRTDHLRFRRNQAGLLDALLAAQPEARCDETFARVREELRRTFTALSRAPQPAGFVGQLRDYQREGLGWMEFLRHFGFGGCLADDMGVGKTAQVLALLETRRAQRAAGQPVAPSLVVVPHSLVFNWQQEAARFTPQLRVLDHTGLARDSSAFAEYDLVLTTYGTLRRDAVRLKEIEFDYVVLDEAQAIKNAATESAKAVRLLRGSAPPGAQRHAGGESPGRAVEPVRVPQSGHAGRGQRVQAGRRRGRATPTRRPAACWPRRCGRSSCAAPRQQVAPRTAREDRADHLLRAGSPRSASSTTNCASTTATRC